MIFLDTYYGIKSRKLNICNTKCRICTGFASSQWVPEEIERDGDTNQFAHVMGRLGRWPELNEDFWTDLENQIEEVENVLYVVTNFFVTLAMELMIILRTGFSFSYIS